MRSKLLFARFLALGVALVLLVVLVPRPARADVPGSELTVSVLTFGPGDHPFYKFGHNAIWVHDERRQRDLVYNFGTFDFESPTLVSDFLKGRLSYWLSVQSLDGTIEHYHEEGRSIVAQKLALSPEQRRAVARRLAENALPANRYYRYDYYRDNCSTRVRDIVDAAVSGQLHDASKAPASLSFRGHTLRLVAEDVSLALALDAAMGDVIDLPVTRWEEMFLPQKLHDTLRDTMIDGPAGKIPLVAEEATILDADRPPLRTEPPRWTPWLLLVGSALGAGLGLLGRAGAKKRAARIGYAVALAALALPAGLLGAIFAFFWIATDHKVAHHNENLLQCSPLGLAVVVLAVGVGRGRARWMQRMEPLLTFVALGAALGLLLKVLPWFDQQNYRIIALMLPTWLGAAWGIRQMRRMQPMRAGAPAAAEKRPAVPEEQAAATAES